MLPIEYHYQEGVDPARGLATDRYFLNSFHKGGRPRAAVLRVYSMRGDWVSAGRYHRIERAKTTPRIWRRLSGGRAMPFGEGFLGFSLLLPHRSALVSDEPFHLSPYQVPNRYARGILTALRGLGIDAFYPGRDFVTVNRKVIAMVTFETDERGALVFEGFIAVERDFGLLARFLAEADPEGHLAGERIDPAAVTSAVAELDEERKPRELAEALRRGFGEQFGVETPARELSPLEEQAIGAIEVREFQEDWLGIRDPGEGLDLAAATPVALGVFEVRLGLEQERFVREVRLTGDFIANSAGVDALERELKLCPADWRSVALVADQIYNRPENYILGIGKLRTIPDTIVKALPA
ncbi:MAG: lipoate--protein ligase family protein [Candidatus Binatia bacterium]